MDGTRIEARRRKRQIQRKKQARLRKVLVIMLVIMAAVTAAIGTWAYFRTNVYQDDEEFQAYAEEQIKDNRIFKVGNVEKISCEYGSPISYAVDYQVIDNESVKEFRDEKVKEAKKKFRKEKTREEKARAKKNSDNKRYRPPEEAIIINTAVYTAENGAVSLAVKCSENEEADKDMHTVKSYISTYLLSEKTGSEIIPAQVLKADYREKCSEFIMDYFEKEYSSDELADNWKDYLTADKSNFNKFVMDDDDFIFYFDEGTVLKKKNGYTEVRVSRSLLEDYLRSSIIERYIDPDRPMVALTYDDGPGGSSETKILDCLEKHGAVATFFYVGSRVSSDPEKISRALEMGCEIGNHTWSHPMLTTLKAKKVKREINNTNEAIKKACGQYPTVLRPSYGDINKKVCRIADMPAILWDVDTLDWKTRNAKKIFKSVKSVKNLDGKIVLMHSIHDETAEATEKIIPWLQKHGYQTVTVSELIKYRQGSEAEKGKIYY